MSAENTTAITTYSEAGNPENLSTVFTATEVVAQPQALLWAQLVLWGVAAAFSLAIFKRKKAWQDALMTIACCMFAFQVLPSVLSLIFPTSETAMHIAGAMLLPMVYSEPIGVAMLAGSAFLRWRGSR